MTHYKSVRSDDHLKHFFMTLTFALFHQHLSNLNRAIQWCKHLMRHRGCQGLEEVVGLLFLLQVLEECNISEAEDLAFFVVKD